MSKHPRAWTTSVLDGNLRNSKEVVKKATGKTPIAVRIVPEADYRKMVKAVKELEALKEGKQELEYSGI